MGDKWTDGLARGDPYIDWWSAVEKPNAERGGVVFGEAPILGDVEFGFQRIAGSEAFTSGEIMAKHVQRRDLAAKTAVPLPVPAHALRPGDIDPGKDPDLYAGLPPAGKLGSPDDGTGLPDDTIIVGVIDTDIPLGHARFRDAEGKSRILAAWQMMAPWAGPDGLRQAYLPFGRELYKDDIDALLLNCSGGSYDGWLDEAAFNTATGVLDLCNQGGRRGIAKRASHGAHVMDVAAGVDPMDDPEFARRVKIVAINIPDSKVFGAPGTFLDEYLRYAILRVADVADAYWLRNHPGRHEKPFGYPLVLNISFGKQAGAKSGLDKLPLFIERLRQRRIEDQNSPIYVTMPAGNDNHLQCNAFVEPDAGRTSELTWRILPEDRSSNFVEVWFSGKNVDKGDERGEVPAASIALVPPGGSEEDHPLSEMAAGQVRRLSKTAAIYCESVAAADGKMPYLLRYVLCVAPTYFTAAGSPTPSGDWTIRLHNRLEEKQIQCRLSVQTDQQIAAGSPNNLRSYFADASYRRYDEAGRWVESECYPADEKMKPDLIGCSPVRRHGTMNSSASNGAVARVSGYRETDGKPATYSATGRGRTDGQDDGTELGYMLADDASGAPTAAFPTDDGPAHFGVLAAGPTDGSVVAMRGTSFASSQATRCVVEQLVHGKASGQSAKSILRQIARTLDDGTLQNRHGQTYPHPVDIDQAGGGRIPSPVRNRIDRMGR